MTSRSVLLDTETTGFSPTKDRIIEVACVELVGGELTGRSYRTLINPGRPVPEKVTAVHGIRDADLVGKPKFWRIAAALLEFLGDDPIIAHNAPFDFRMVNAELSRLSRPLLAPGRMVDTLAMAKALFPGQPNSLDALCVRFGVDRTDRTTHDALVDCQLLARVYAGLRPVPGGDLLAGAMS